MKAPKIPLTPQIDIVEHTVGVLEDVTEKLETNVGRVVVDRTLYHVRIQSERLLPAHEDCERCETFRNEVEKLYGRVLELLDVVKSLPEGRVREQMSYELRALVGELYESATFWTILHVQKEGTRNTYRSSKTFYWPS